MAKTIFTADDFLIKVCKTIGIDPSMTRRIIIDGRPAKPLTVYAEMYADKPILDLDWAEGLTGAQIKVLDK